MEYERKRLCHEPRVLAVDAFDLHNSAHRSYDKEKEEEDENGISLCVSYDYLMLCGVVVRAHGRFPID
jgi:hypothetical protein